MRTIKTSDNNGGGYLLDDEQLSSKRLQNLSQISISDLASKQGENLLIFPHCLNAEHYDLDGSDKLFDIQNNKLQTFNYMGFIGCGDVEVHITSRFDNGENNLFLHYMLQRIFAVNMFDWQISRGKTSIWDFLIYLFPNALKSAVQQGIFKRYQRRGYNDSRIRGVIDVAHHLRQNIPFAGKVAYNTREYSYDNNLTQLIRHTIEYLITHPMMGRNALHADSETYQAVQQIIAATPTYNRSNRERIIVANLRPERHPYFTEYTMLQSLCVKILRREKLSYDTTSVDKVHGLVFDGAWLWEKYLNTILSKVGYKHYDNRKGGRREYLFRGRTGDYYYPDFYNSERSFVVDAKYKWMNDKINRSDIYQIISYLHCLKADRGALIYPQKRGDESSSSKYGILRGYGGEIYRFYLEISHATEYGKFCSEMQNAEEVLVTQMYDSNLVSS